MTSDRVYDLITQIITYLEAIQTKKASSNGFTMVSIDYFCHIWSLAYEDGATLHGWASDLNGNNTPSYIPAWILRGTW